MVTTKLHRVGSSLGSCRILFDMLGFHVLILCYIYVKGKSVMTWPSKVVDRYLWPTAYFAWYFQITFLDEDKGFGKNRKWPTKKAVDRVVLPWYGGVSLLERQNPENEYPSFSTATSLSCLFMNIRCQSHTKGYPGYKKEIPPIVGREDHTYPLTNIINAQRLKTASKFLSSRDGHYIYLLTPLTHHINVDLQSYFSSDHV